MRVERLALALIAIASLAVACGSEDRADALGGGALDQIGKAQRVQVEATLRTAVMAQEAYFAQSGTYTSRIEDLTAGGVSVPADVSLQIASASTTSFCIQATHTGEGGTLHYAKETGAVEDGPC
jgi:Type IV minor pilin ComP, DNA uptake sequence receptor